MHVPMLFPKSGIFCNYSEPDRFRKICVWFGSVTKFYIDMCTLTVYTDNYSRYTHEKAINKLLLNFPKVILWEFSEDNGLSP